MHFIYSTEIKENILLFRGSLMKLKHPRYLALLEKSCLTTDKCANKKLCKGTESDKI